MNLKSFNGSARRRGTTIAAAALSVAMVAPFVHPIASPQTAAVAQAQESDAPASNANVIEADAIANGYIGSATDMTNAKSTLSGRAYIDDGSGFGPTDAGNLPVPEGTTVYMQWIDKDGAVSPVYSAKTSNQLSSDKTSQAGPGAYAFDLREPWTDVHGKDHTYTASAKQYYKLWINPFTDERNGATVVPFRQVGGFFPGAFRNSAGASQQGAWNTIGTNMQRTSVLMQNEGDTSYMHKPKAEWVKDTEETLPNQSGNLGMKNHVGGRVWLETRDVRVDGPDMTGSDVAAAGFNVVMSVLTPEGIGEYAAKVETLPLAQQQAAAKQLLEEHPEYIAETVTTKVGEDGYYSVKFSDGKLTNESKKYLYAHVESPDGKPMIGYSGWRLPLYQSPTANGARNPNPIAAQNLVANPMWYNVNFALVPRHNVSLDITNYDMTENPARAGDTPALDVKGPFPVTPNKIVWKKNGEEFKTCEGITSEAEANKCVFVVPEDAVKGDVFTAEFVTGDNTVIAADSFVVTDKPYAEELEPEYGGKKVVPGTPVESEPTFKKQDENGNVTDETVKTPEGSKFSIPDDFKVPEGYTVDIDESTGKVTVDADPEKLNKDTVEEFEVPVTVEYPDGSKDDAKAKFELDTDGDGTPDSKDDDDDGDGVSDEDEKDKGTNPKDKGEFPMTPLDPAEDTTSATVEPSYGDVAVTPEKPAVSKPTFKEEDSEGNVTDKTVDTPEGSEFSIPGNFTAPEGYTVEVDPDTGDVTVTVDKDKLNKDTVEEFEVPVTVEYPDGSKDDAKAKFELDTDGDGTPDSKDDDDDGDGVSDEDEKDKGTNPKDKGEFPATPLEPGTKNPDWDNTSTTPDKPVEIPNTGGSV
ncbi:YPDG domain-containing protein, partial [Corynebacterium sp. UMB6689]|uniref:YPDG domain-containing protein n=1 Tax=Corynebacterium sp. UMB6689 TaxID=3046341 RepID=UPI00254A1024